MASNDVGTMVVCSFTAHAALVHSVDLFVPKGKKSCTVKCTDTTVLRLRTMIVIVWLAWSVTVPLSRWCVVVTWSASAMMMASMLAIFPPGKLRIYYWNDCWWYASWSNSVMCCELEAWHRWGVQKQRTWALGQAWARSSALRHACIGLIGQWGQNPQPLHCAKLIGLHTYTSRVCVWVVPFISYSSNLMTITLHFKPTYNDLH